MNTVYGIPTFDELFEDLFRLNKDSFRFNSPISRVYETYVLDENTKLLTLNLLGISPENIEVEVTNQPSGLQMLKVSATTENKIIGKKYSYNNEFTVGSSRRELETYEWEAKDGILYIALRYKKISQATPVATKGKGLLESLSAEVSKKEQK